MALYRKLHDDEIRVIKLFTEEDDPEFTRGPIRCKLEYVSLNASNLVSQDQLEVPRKGHCGSWPCLTVENIEVQPGKRKGADSNVLWGKAATADKFLQAARRNFRPASNTEMKTDRSLSPDRPTSNLGIEDEEAELAWRYSWGDFVALSYVWGDPAVKGEIIVNDSKMVVTANLEAALSQLRDHCRIKQGFRIWADAICINQDDMEERAQQVAKMKYIYDSAWHVTIWLGPESDDSDLAMIAMKYFSLRSGKDQPFKGIYYRFDKILVNIPRLASWHHGHLRRVIRIKVIKAIYHLLARPYFRRLWVLQEIASGARNSPILCDGSQLGKWIIHSVKGQRALQQSWDQISVGNDLHTASEQLWERPIAMIEAQNNLRMPKHDSSHNYIFNALLLSRVANTSDERDRVFGIIGLPCLATTIKMVPDYSFSPTSIFTLFSKSLFTSGDLDGLRLVASQIPSIDMKYFKPYSLTRSQASKQIRHPKIVSTGCKHSLPSWVICWSCPRDPAINLCGHAFIIEKYNTRPVFQENTLMTIRGILFDAVSSLSTFHATESDLSFPFNGLLVKSVYGDINATKAAIW